MAFGPTRRSRPTGLLSPALYWNWNWKSSCFQSSQVELASLSLRLLGHHESASE